MVEISRRHAGAIKSKTLKYFSCVEIFLKNVVITVLLGKHIVHN